MIDKAAFGSTGHQSSRLIFGAAALGAMKQEKADPILDLLLEYGINHIDTAAAYGDSELRIAPWMRQHRKSSFWRPRPGTAPMRALATASIGRSIDSAWIRSI